MLNSYHKRQLSYLFKTYIAQDPLLIEFVMEYTRDKEQLQTTVAG